MQNRESKIERALRDRVRKAGGLCIKITSPGSAGFPDRLILLNGHVIFAEIKRPGRGLDPLQAYWQSELRRQGCICIKLDHVDQIREVIQYEV